MIKIYLSVALFVIISQIGFSQNLNKEKLDNYFNVLELHNKFMGSVAISKNGEIIYKKSIGFADVDNKIKANENTKYRIGSISKSFTAVMVLKGVEDKKINLNQTIDKWFPMITNAKKITIKNLLNHRSGIHNFTDNKDYLTWNTQPKTAKEMIEIITKSGSDFEPNNKSAYSNSNFVLLSFILEKTFNKSYAELLQEYIVQPIGLLHTYVFGKIDPNNNECKSYRFVEAWKKASETDYTIPLGAGAITSTPSDLVKFSDALFGGKLLKPESLKLMQSIKDGYGIGLFRMPFYSSIGYGHTGGIDGFTSVYSYFSNEKVSYALTSNGTRINNNDISIAILSAIFDKPFEIPVFETYHLTSEDLNNYLGVYVSKKIPLKITITKKENTLIAQGTGQPAFPLEAIGKDRFKFDQAGAKFEFNPVEKTMILFQGGGQIKFKKE